MQYSALSPNLSSFPLVPLPLIFPFLSWFLPYAIAIFPGVCANMAQIVVRNGIQAVGEGLTSLVVVGKRAALQAVKYDGQFQEVANKFFGGKKHEIAF